MCCLLTAHFSLFVETPPLSPNFLTLGKFRGFAILVSAAPAPLQLCLDVPLEVRIKC